MRHKYTFLSSSMQLLLDFRTYTQFPNILACTQLLRHSLIYWPTLKTCACLNLTRFISPFKKTVTHIFVVYIAYLDWLFYGTFMCEITYHK
jgi:hypothetical protein